MNDTGGLIGGVYMKRAFAPSCDHSLFDFHEPSRRSLAKLQIDFNILDCDSRRVRRGSLSNNKTSRKQG